MSMDISVVFCQYNPDYEKVIQSLYSLISQKEINFEIIIADDGSIDDCFDRIESFFKKNKFENYLLHKNPVNIGIVKNYLSGIELAQGKYIFMNSPGDIFVNDYVLRDYFQFAAKHNADCLFADAVYYSEKDGVCTVKSFTTNPPKPQCYYWFMPQCIGKSALFRGRKILGAVFLRKKEYALKYISEITSISKYVEDYPSSLLSVMDGKKIVYYEKVILWYDSGTSRSKEENERWHSIIGKDIDEANLMIKKRYASDPLHDFYDQSKNKIARKLRHPILLIVNFIYDTLFFEKKTMASKEVEDEINNYFDYISKMINEEGCD